MAILWMLMLYIPVIDEDAHHMMTTENSRGAISVAVQTTTSGKVCTKCGAEIVVYIL